MPITDLDKSLAQLIVKFRKATAEQVKPALAELQRWHEHGRKGDLADVLVAHRVVTAKAARQLRIMATREAAPEIPGYKIIEPLGGGGMGVVYLARQEELDRDVALKVLRPDALDDAEAVQRFMREARAAGKLDHPNIVRAWDVSPGDASKGIPPYLAMEYIRGETLHQVLQRQKQLSEKQALLIGRAVADALDHAFKAGLVHRDVKPDNIMISQDGMIRLCDLGLAKSVNHDQSITRPEMTHGTPHFMSPEQARGERDLDIRSDLYSLGCTLYRVVVGRPPFNADSAMEILIKHIEQPPASPKAVRPELSIGFERIVLKLLAKDPANRYQYPAHVASDIGLVMDGEKPRLEYHVPFRQARPKSIDGSASGVMMPPPAAASAVSDDAHTATGDAATQDGTVDFGKADPHNLIAREADKLKRHDKMLAAAGMADTGRRRKPGGADTDPSQPQPSGAGTGTQRRQAATWRHRMLLTGGANGVLLLG
ncbi:MAG: serine/threonine-protein kinase, partial [Planctomycetota bacterium]